jgi:hypothetical protein
MPGNDEIKIRAHQLWERAGRPSGRDHEFWSRAEQQLNEDLARFRRAFSALQGHDKEPERQGHAAPDNTSVTDDEPPNPDDSNPP